MDLSHGIIDGKGRVLQASRQLTGDWQPADIELDRFI